MGKIINGVKYICIHDINDYKKMSLNDNLYFTLRDIFWNADSERTMSEANHFARGLTGGIQFEDRTDKFQYTNILNQKNELEQILQFINRIKYDGWFEFTELDLDDDNDDDEVDEEYIKYDYWWKQFEELKNILKVHYKKISI